MSIFENGDSKEPKVIPDPWALVRLRLLDEQFTAQRLERQRSRREPLDVPRDRLGLAAGIVVVVCVAGVVACWLLLLLFGAPS